VFAALSARQLQGHTSSAGPLIGWYERDVNRQLAGHVFSVPHAPNSLSTGVLFGSAFAVETILTLDHIADKTPSKGESLQEVEAMRRDVRKYRRK
jgi:hypothetical protein